MLLGADLMTSAGNNQCDVIGGFCIFNRVEVVGVCRESPTISDRTRPVLHPEPPGAEGLVRRIRPMPDLSVICLRILCEVRRGTSPDAPDRSPNRAAQRSPHQGSADSTCGHASCLDLRGRRSHRIVLRRTDEHMLPAHSQVVCGLRPRPRTADQNDVVSTWNAPMHLSRLPHCQRTVGVPDGSHMRVFILIRCRDPVHELVVCVTPRLAPDRQTSPPHSPSRSPTGACGAS